MACRWFSVCPLRRHERQGKIGLKWREEYCNGDYCRCERFKQESAGIPHSDRLLPDGSYLEGPGRP